MHDTVSRPDAVSLNRAAYGQDGYFTSRQAAEHGFSAQLLAHHVRSGRYERVRRGLYRLSGYPASTHDEVRERWLAVGAKRAVVSHESALELHGLSDVLPNTVHLLVDRDDRGVKPPPGVTLHTTTRPIDSAEVVRREGIRVTAPARSIVDAASGGTGPEQIESAVQQALEEGLVTPRSLLAQLERHGSARVGRVVRRALDQGGSA
jgi:predicted transcriptional regulator of viral defense system